MAYTTAQLLDIIDAEMKAAVKGQRLLLNGDRRLDNPVITKAIGPPKLSQIYAFQDFREHREFISIKLPKVSFSLVIVWREMHPFKVRSVPLS